MTGMTEHPPIDVAPSGEDTGGKAQDERRGRASEAHTALSITRQYIKDYSFENPNAPGIYSSLRDEDPEIKVGVDVTASPLGDLSHEVVLSVTVRATYQENIAFIIELDYAAQTEFDANVSKERSERLLMVEVPRYIFPFARSIVVNATREGGFQPLLLNPINFAKIHENSRTKQASKSTKEN
jgi:preprotein translocase subunit SecB